MGPTLRSYVSQKIHPALQGEGVRCIVISGWLQRALPAHIAPFELDQPLDFRRPTVSALDSTTFELHCFPSENYMIHYASLIATYFALYKSEHRVLILMDPVRVNTGFYRISAYPGPPDTTFHHLFNLHSMGSIDIAIFGEVHHLKGLYGGSWKDGGGSYEGVLRWRKLSSPNGKTIALMGCLEKVWGDAGEHLIQALHSQTRVKQIVYVAKAGSLSERYAPNEWIATGERAMIGKDAPTVWQNPLQNALSASTRVASGSIITVPSTLCETHEWLEEWSPKALWVDCEVCYMASVAQELHIDFGFLSVVSDNLCRRYEEDLSNEYSDTVTEKRRVLYNEIVKILKKFISE
ncbi:hypothetical protein PG995_012141 [Apiospora arundinis]